MAQWTWGLQSDATPHLSEWGAVWGGVPCTAVKSAMGNVLKTLRPGPMVWLGASVGIALARTGPTGGVISAVLAVNALIERLLELSTSMRLLHGDLAASGIFAKLEEKRMANALLLQQHGACERERQTLAARAVGKLFVVPAWALPVPVSGRLKGL
jgi:hypothetical protein